MFCVGFAAACITPPLGKDVPGLFERRLAEGVHDDLFTRAVVIDDGVRCVALVQTDAIVISEETVAEARKEAHRLCGISGRNCLIAATHTHSGGPTFGGFLSEPDPEYAAFVTSRIATVIAEAHRRRRAALAGTGSARAEGVAFNRRFIMKNGSQQTHPGKMNPDIVDPAGPEDPTVTVVGFCDAGRRAPVGCIVNFACHATHMNGLLYSADYVRWVVDTLEAVYGRGFGVVYLNGACGDVTQMDNRSARSNEFGPYWCERTGRVIAGGAVQAMARMDYLTEATVACRSASVSAGIRRSTPEARANARAVLTRKAISAEDVETIYAHELRAVESMRRKTPERALEIMGLRIADALFWGVPAEFFQAFALRVRDASPFPHTCCVELANGYNGYICTPAAFAGGGYEIRTARSSFLEPDTGDRIVDAARKLCTRMFRDAEPELRALPGRRTWPTVEDSALDGISQLRPKR